MPVPLFPLRNSHVDIYLVLHLLSPQVLLNFLPWQTLKQTQANIHWGTSVLFLFLRKIKLFIIINVAFILEPWHPWQQWRLNSFSQSKLFENFWCLWSQVFNESLLIRFQVCMLYSQIIVSNGSSKILSTSNHRQCFFQGYP